MSTTLILFFIGFVFLIKGADILVAGSSSIAKRFGISNLVIGLTIVAFGTSAPELIVSVFASVKGSAGIALGNIIGSNISNTLLILGIAAVIYPLVVKKTTISKEIPLSLLAVIALGLLVNDEIVDGEIGNWLTRIDGLMLILFFVIFLYYTFSSMKQEKNDNHFYFMMADFFGKNHFLNFRNKITDQLKIEIPDDVMENVEHIGGENYKEYSFLTSLSMIILGMLGLFFGGTWIVNGAVYFAGIFGLSEALVGLTIIAVGTSLPELAASAMAAYRHHSDIAIGNVVGSNIFNIFWVLGLSSVIRPVPYDQIMNFDLLILLSITIVTLFLIFIGKKNVLGRWEGVTLILLYVLYIIFLIVRG